MNKSYNLLKGLHKQASSPMGGPNNAMNFPGSKGGMPPLGTAAGMKAYRDQQEHLKAQTAAANSEEATQMAVQQEQLKAQVAQQQEMAKWEQKRQQEAMKVQQQRQADMAKQQQAQAQMQHKFQQTQAQQAQKMQQAQMQQVQKMQQMHMQTQIKAQQTQMQQAQKLQEERTKLHQDFSNKEMQLRQQMAQKEHQAIGKVTALQAEKQQLEAKHKELESKVPQGLNPLIAKKPESLLRRAESLAKRAHNPNVEVRQKAYDLALTKLAIDYGNAYKPAQPAQPSTPSKPSTPSRPVRASDLNPPTKPVAPDPNTHPDRYAEASNQYNQNMQKYETDYTDYAKKVNALRPQTSPYKAPSTALPTPVNDTPPSGFEALTGIRNWKDFKEEWPVLPMNTVRSPEMYNQRATQSWVMNKARESGLGKWLGLDWQGNELYKDTRLQGYQPGDPSRPWVGKNWGETLQNSARNVMERTGLEKDLYNVTRWGTGLVDGTRNFFARDILAPTTQGFNNTIGDVASFAMDPSPQMLKTVLSKENTDDRKHLAYGVANIFGGVGELMPHWMSGTGKYAENGNWSYEDWAAKERARLLGVTPETTYDRNKNPGAWGNTYTTALQNHYKNVPAVKAMLDAQAAAGPRSYSNFADNGGGSDHSPRSYGAAGLQSTGGFHDNIFMGTPPPQLSQMAMNFAIPQVNSGSFMPSVSSDPYSQFNAAFQNSAQLFGLAPAAAYSNMYR